MMNVGWIGLGAMGAPMASCLARAGHQVHAFNQDLPAPQPSPAKACSSRHRRRAAAAPTFSPSWSPPLTRQSGPFGDGTGPRLCDLAPSSS